MLNQQKKIVDRQGVFITLWVFIVINMAYADILSLMDSTSPIRQIMNGKKLPGGGLILGSILMETGIVMILFSKILPYNIGKWLNIFFALINILAVLNGGHGSYYYIFASIEMIALIFIIILSIKWKTLD